MRVRRECVLNLAAAHELPNLMNGRVEAMGPAVDHEEHLIPLGGLDHAVAIFEAESHRLLEHDVLAPLDRRQGVLYVQVMRGRDVNDVDVRAPGARPSSSILKRTRSLTSSS